MTVRVEPVGWQWKVVKDGALVKVCDSKEEASAIAAEERKK